MSYRCSRAHSTVMVSGATSLNRCSDFPTQESARRCSVRSLAPLGMTSDEEYVSPFF